MDTDELIAALAADDTPATPPRLVRRMLAGAVVSAVLMAAFWGIRPDWSAAVQTAPVLVKQTLPAVIGLFAIFMLANGPEGRRSLWVFGAIAAAAALAWGAAMLAGGDMMGTSVSACLASIPALAIPMGVPLFLGLRHRIEPRPARTGTIAGILAGAASATIYAIHCDEDSAAFFLLWYGVAIAACGLAGRIAGRRYLGV